MEVTANCPHCKSENSYDVDLVAWLGTIGNFEYHTETFDRITARVILHEFDHIEGKLFIDYLNPLKKRMIKSKLDDISKGKVRVDYRMLFPKK
jgi:hypothetical protein